MTAKEFNEIKKNISQIFFNKINTFIEYSNNNHLQLSQEEQNFYENRKKLVDNTNENEAIKDARDIITNKNLGRLLDSVVSIADFDGQYLSPEKDSSNNNPKFYQLIDLASIQNFNQEIIDTESFSCRGDCMGECLQACFNSCLDGCINTCLKGCQTSCTLSCNVDCFSNASGGAAP